MLNNMVFPYQESMKQQYYCKKSAMTWGVPLLTVSCGVHKTVCDISKIIVMLDMMLHPDCSAAFNVCKKGGDGHEDQPLSFQYHD